VEEWNIEMMGVFRNGFLFVITIIPSFQHSIISDLLNFAIHLTFGF